MLTRPSTPQLVDGRELSAPPASTPSSFLTASASSATATTDAQRLSAQASRSS
jgi:hypothetical protein